MQTIKLTHFLRDWGFHVALVAVTLPIVGLAYLAWTLTPAQVIPPTAASSAEPVRWSALDIIAAFHSAGLEAQLVRGETKEERDGMATLMVVDARRFRISGKDKELGSVLCFQDRDDLERMQRYLLALNRTFPQFRSWIFVRDNVLLQINHEVSEDTAHAYADVLFTLDR